jgi:cytochrome c oxidase subunit 4
MTSDPHTQPDADDDAPHVSSALGYVVVWLALVVLATGTLLASRAIGGGAGLVIAALVAAAKAGLVLAFFMHLAHGRPIHRLIFALAMGFLILLVVGVLADVGTRAFASAYVDDVGAAQ